VEWTGDLDAKIFFHLLRVSTHLRSCSPALVTDHDDFFQHFGLNRVENDSVSQLTVELNSLSAAPIRFSPRSHKSYYQGWDQRE
jgi:hypothetical protein